MTTLLSTRQLPASDSLNGAQHTGVQVTPLTETGNVRVEKQESRSLQIQRTLQQSLPVAPLACPKPDITDQTDKLSVAPGTTATLVVNATKAVTWTWYAGAVDDRKSPMATTNSGSWITPPIARTTQFWCEVSSACGATDKSKAMTVEPSCLPPAVSDRSGTTTVASGQPARLFVVVSGGDENGDQHGNGGGKGSGSVSYQWFRGADGTRTSPLGPGVSGDNGSTYISAPLTADAQFWCEVTNGCGAASTGTITVHVTTACTPPSIAPQGGMTMNIGKGASATFNVTAGGTQPLTITWYAGAAGDRSHPAGTGPSLTTPSLTNDSTYWAEAANGCGAAATPEFSVHVAVECTPPGAAPQVSANGQATSGALYVVRWDAIPGVSGYEIDEAQAEDFYGARTIHEDLPVATFAHSVTQPAAYYYRVRGTSPCGAAGPSSAGVRVIVVLAAGHDGDLVAPFGSSDPVQGNVSAKLTEAANGTFDASATEDWVTLSPSSGLINGDGSIQLNATVDPRALPPGTSTATVLVKASNGATASAPVSITLVTPVKSTPRASTAGGGTLVIPAAAHAAGAASQWVSDVRLAHTFAQSTTYEVGYAGSSGTTTATTTVTVQPGQTIAMNDIVAHWFGGGLTGDGGTGFITIRALDASGKGSTFAASRLYNAGALGSFGQFVPAIPLERFLAAGGSARMSLPGLAQSAQFRTNVGLVEASNQPATVRLDVYDGSGAKLFDKTVDLGPGQQSQFGNFLAANGVTNGNARVDIHLVSQTGVVFPYGSVIDNATGDPLFIPGFDTARLSTMTTVLPGVANAPATGGSWQSDVRLFNPTDGSLTATVAFLRMGATTAASTQTVTIAPGEVRAIDNVLDSMFGATGSGQLVITTTTPSSLVATARTYNRRGDATYGQFIPGATVNDSVGRDERPLELLQVEESPRFRTNVGIAEITGKPVTFDVTVVVPGSKVASHVSLSLQPNEYRQLNSLVRTLGFGDAYNVHLSLRVTEGEGRIIGYASVIDNATQDPTYVSAQ